MPYKVRVAVHSVTKGKCAQGFKAGDTWLIEDGKTPGGMCASAYNAVAPAIRVFRLGGEHPWDKDKDVTYVSCPDPEHWVIYEVRRSNPPQEGEACNRGIWIIPPVRPEPVEGSKGVHPSNTERAGSSRMV